MTRRVTLTIPDNLGERIDRFRDNLNQSAIFAAAIEKELRKLELPKATGDFRGVISRLRPQREAVRQQSYDWGLGDGKAYARAHASYDELEEIGALADSTDWPRIEPFNRIPREAQESVRDYGKDREADARLQWTGYCEGWADGMVAVWNAVKDHLDDEDDEDDEEESE